MQNNLHKTGLFAKCDIAHYKGLVYNIQNFLCTGEVLIFLIQMITIQTIKKQEIAENKGAENVGFDNSGGQKEMYFTECLSIGVKNKHDGAIDGVAALACLASRC